MVNKSNFELGIVSHLETPKIGNNNNNQALQRTVANSNSNMPSGGHW